jgi:hypothetical protein
MFIRSCREEVTAAACGLNNDGGGVPLGRVEQPPRVMEIAGKIRKNGFAENIV